MAAQQSPATPRELPLGQPLGQPAAAAAALQRAASGVQPRRSRAARRDPLEPKQNKTPFNFFSIDARAKAKAEHPTADQKVAHAPVID